MSIRSMVTYLQNISPLLEMTSSSALKGDETNVVRLFQQNFYQPDKHSFLNEEMKPSDKATINITGHKITAVKIQPYSEDYAAWP